MLSSALFRNGDIVTPCQVSTRRIRMLYKPQISCGYDSISRTPYFYEPTRVIVRQTVGGWLYYNIESEGDFGYDWTDEAFAEAQPIFKYLDWKENGNELR